MDNNFERENNRTREIEHVRSEVLRDFQQSDTAMALRQIADDIEGNMRCLMALQQITLWSMSHESFRWKNEGIMALQVYTNLIRNISNNKEEISKVLRL